MQKGPHKQRVREDPNICLCGPGSPGLEKSAFDGQALIFYAANRGHSPDAGRSWRQCLFFVKESFRQCHVKVVCQTAEIIRLNGLAL